MTNLKTDIRRAARQVLATDRLFGADAVPIAPMAVTPVEAGTRSDKQSRLEALRERHDRECPHCTTVTTHTQTVFGEGNPDARLMFVGEAPGAEEDKTGRPFVGRAGQLLDKMITAMGLAREDVFIANILKSRPPNNATPTPAEVEKCSPYLAEQIEIIEPEVIVALGSPSAKFMLDTKEGISKLRGRFHRCTIGSFEVDVMPTYHPAYLLRNYTPEARGKVWSDLQMALKHLGLDG